MSSEVINHKSSSYSAVLFHSYVVIFIQLEMLRVTLTLFSSANLVIDAVFNVSVFCQHFFRSVKTVTYESLNNVVRLINGVSALLLTILPGKSTILEGIHGWELRPTFRGPRLPQWMEK